MFDIKTTGDVFELQGEINILDIQKFYEFLIKINQKNSHIKLDLKEVSNIDSAVIQLLVSLKKSLKQGSSLTIKSMSEKVESALKLMGLYNYLIKRLA